MLAARFYGGKDIRLEQVPDPVPDPGQVLVRVLAAGICGSDLHGYRQGTPSATARTPGHELAGQVVALGHGVQGWAVGDRVAIEPLVGCGRCPYCRAGDYHLCPDLEHIGGARSGGFAQFTVAPQDRLYPLPEQVPMDHASLLDVYAVAVHALSRVPVAPGERVAVIGSGAIGLSIAQLAAVAGGEVAVLGRRPAPLRIAAETAGATGIVLDAHSAEAVRAWSGGDGADVVFEAVGGTAQTLSLALELAAPRGRVGVVGSFREAQLVDVRLPMRHELSLYWVWSYALRQGRPEFAIALDLLARGKLQAEPLITHRYPLERIQEAFAVADNKQTGNSIKVIVQP
ncbi:MAG: zinc-dependent alcohol dehydrogenase [Anaerolineae bacterium]|jgi:threonine dehydrogenase-like Zn-dependent dehydrogenase|nr:alcohol dehydrogenase catalytic domain-containing protein [Chloroflexota bacterium]